MGLAWLMDGVVQLLRWQWLAYWRRILRGGTAAKTNLLVLGLIGAAAFARYLTFLRDAAKQTSAGQTSLLEILLAALLLLWLQPGWDAGKLALGTRDMARFPLTARSRFGLRVLSCFVSPVNWALAAVTAAGIWPVLALPHPANAAAAYFLLAMGGFAAGLALVDLSQTAKGAVPVRLLWLTLAIASGAWWATTHTFPRLPSHLIAAAGQGQWIAVILAAAIAGISLYAAFLALPWMLGQAPPAERSRQARSAQTLTLFRREWRLLTRMVEARTSWVISIALALYLATASHPEPDALRVMLGILAFLGVAIAMNSFGLDGASGLDRFLLMPVSGRRIVTAKNKAFALAVSAPVIPLACLAGWQFGWREGTADLLEAVALGFAMLAWGNVTSVLHPEGGGSGSGGNVIDQFVATILIGITTACAVAALRGSIQTAPVYLLGLALLFAAIYAVSMWWSAAYFARHYEQIRAKII